MAAPLQRSGMAVEAMRAEAVPEKGATPRNVRPKVVATLKVPPLQPVPRAIVASRPPPVMAVAAVRAAEMADDGATLKKRRPRWRRRPSCRHSSPSSPSGQPRWQRLCRRQSWQWRLCGRRRWQRTARRHGEWWPSSRRRPRCRRCSRRSRGRSAQDSGALATTRLGGGGGEVGGGAKEWGDATRNGTQGRIDAEVVAAAARASSAGGASAAARYGGGS